MWAIYANFNFHEARPRVVKRFTRRRLPKSVRRRLEFTQLNEFVKEDSPLFILFVFVLDEKDICETGF